MKDPTVTLSFIRNRHGESESPLDAIGVFDLVRHPQREGLWMMERRETVQFPNGDTIELYAEANSSCNMVHINSGAGRVISWKAASDVDLMFLLPSGEEAYVSMEVDRNLVR